PYLQNALDHKTNVRSHNDAARMRGRTAHVKVIDRRAVIRPSRNGPQEEKLLKRKFALKNIPLREAKFALQVERRKNLFADDDVFDVRRVFGNRLDDVIAEGF